MLEKDDTIKTEGQKPEDAAAEAFLEKERKRLYENKTDDNHLFLRNILNSIFIILAILAMIGVLVFKSESFWLTISYAVGIVAVLVKMVEVMLRMPGMKKQEPRYKSRLRTKR